MSQHYSDPTRETDPHALPDVETFYVDAEAAAEMHELSDDDAPFAIGWYWQACFPGCLPDGDPIGPFDTEAEAIADAQDSE